MNNPTAIASAGSAYLSFLLKLDVELLADLLSGADASLLHQGYKPSEIKKMGNAAIKIRRLMPFTGLYPLHSWYLQRLQAGGVDAPAP